MPQFIGRGSTAIRPKTARLGDRFYSTDEMTLYEYGNGGWLQLPVIPPVQVVSAGYTVALTDYGGLIVASGTAPIKLPIAPPDGFEITVKRIDATNATTVSAQGGDTTELTGVNATSRTLGSNGASVQVWYKAGIWYCVAQQGTVS